MLQKPRPGFSYTFDDEHDSGKPAQYFFQQTPEGTVLFVIFYTLACRFGMCTGCTLPALSASKKVPFHALMQQVDALFAAEDVAARAHEIVKVIVSNNGSVLDQETFPTIALMYLTAVLKSQLPNLRTVTLESRIEYIDTLELDIFARALKEDSDPSILLEIAVGVEAFDDKIRNKYFHKALTLEKLRQLAVQLAARKFALKCYFMLKPVAGITDEEAIADIRHAIDFLDEMSRTTGCIVNMHLNPTYAAKNTPLGFAFEQQRYTPPTLEHLRQVALAAKDKALTLFFGLSDEGLAVPGGSFIRPGDEALLARLEEFNRTRDFALLG